MHQTATGIKADAFPSKKGTTHEQASQKEGAATPRYTVKKSFRQYSI